MMMIMSSECAVESNRSNVKDDEKSFGSEKSGQNNNTNDMSSETTDNSRNNMDKKNENGHTMQSDVNGKRQKAVCYDFKKGICRRRFCRVSTTTINIWNMVCDCNT